MDNYVALMREINKNISINSRIYGEFANKHRFNNLETPILYSLLIFKNLTQNDIANEYLLPKQTVNNIIKKFEGLGIVMLNQDFVDKRKKIITLTDKGVDYITKQLGPMLDAENEAAKMLGCDKLNNVINSLKELNDALRALFRGEEKWFILIKN